MHSLEVPAPINNNKGGAMPTPGKSLVGFMNQQLAVQYLRNSCAFDPALDDAALIAIWQLAKAKLGAPTPQAGTPEIQDIPATHTGYIASLMSQPYLADAWSTSLAGAGLKLVEIEPLLAFQFSVDNLRSDHHCTKLTSPPTLDELLEMCLPLVPPVDPVSVVQGPQSMLITSRSLNFRSLAQGFMNGGFVGMHVGMGLPLAHAEPSPEIRKIRLIKLPLVCMAPLFLAEELLRMEGFDEVEWVSAVQDPGPNLVASGKADLIQWAMMGLIPFFDDGNSITLLAGIHSGCEELLAHSHIGAVRDLRGKRLAISAYRSSEHMHLSSILAYIGIDPIKAVTWIIGSDTTDPERLFRERKVDAFIGFAPQPQLMRTTGLGHTILDTATDRPWSQYFCCGLAARTEFVRKYPVATKRAMRAILRVTSRIVRFPTGPLSVDPIGHDRRRPVGRLG